MLSHFICGLTHVVFGVLLFVMGIVDLGLSFRDDFIGLIGFKFSVIFSGVWVGKLIYFFPPAVSGSKLRLHISAYITCKGEKVRSEPFLAVCTCMHS